MALGVTVLGSGSRGNAIVIHTDSAALVIDNGFSRKEFLRRLNEHDISEKLIQAIVVSHEHSDHVKGVRVLSDQLEIPTYCARDTFRYLTAKKQVGKKSVLFEPGTTFDIGEFSVEPFTVPHDAVQPVAFVIRANGRKIGIATDLGQVNKLAQQRLYDCDLLCLESNYDMDLLRSAERPLSLKRRIMGRHGHLDNLDAMEALEFIVTAKTKYLVMAHVSSDCNKYELVEKLTSEQLAKMDRADIVSGVARQDESLAPIWLD